MCGLVGMAGSFNLALRSVMKDLLFFDTLRGKDSTGLASVRRNRQVNLKKSTLPGYEFIDNPNMDQWLGVTDQLWMGHNRFKTVGDANRANAHPFMVLDEKGLISTIGAHNGTLRNKWEIEKALEGDDKFGTDSEALINLIAEVGIKDAIAEATGAWSMTIWDACENTINFIRNRERPMVFAWTKDKKTLIWASEAWMILASCRRHGIELFVEEGSDTPCYSTTEDTLYTLAIPQQQGTKFEDFVREGGVRGKPEQKFQGYSGGGYASGREFWDNLERDYDGATSGGTKPEATKEVGKEKSELEPTTREIVTIGTPPVGGPSITKTELDAMRKKGCGWCSGAVTNAQPTCLTKGELLCPACLHGTDDRREFVLRRDTPVEEPNNVIKMPQREAAESAKTRLQNIVNSVKRGASK